MTTTDSITDGGPAFPQATVIDPHTGDISWGDEGMSLRAYLAGQAVAGLDLEEWVGIVLEDETMNSKKAYGSIAKHAVGVADALIAELNKEPRQ